MKTHNLIQGLVAAFLVMVCLAGSGFAQFTSDEVAQRDFWEEFLCTAQIVQSRQLSQNRGITQPYVLILKKDGIRQKAIWKPIEGLYKGFLENWRWEIAAYRVDKFLGLNMVPPTVEREFMDKRGSLQLWITAKSGLKADRENSGLPTGSQASAYNRSLYLQRAFDRLIGNEDRHLGNFLFTADGRMVLIDHSRSFRTSKVFTDSLEFGQYPWNDDNDIKQLPALFVDKVVHLNAQILVEIAGSYLTDDEINAVLLRRDLVLDEMSRIIGENGLSDVLY